MFSKRKYFILLAVLYYDQRMLKHDFFYLSIFADTSRHYLPIDVIKQIIESMSYAKLVRYISYKFLSFFFHAFFFALLCCDCYV